MVAKASKPGAPNGEYQCWNMLILKDNNFLHKYVVVVNFVVCHMHILCLYGSEEKELLGVGSIIVAILPSCQYITILHHICIDMNIVG